jgi:SNF family Na+-dependent transporter
LQEKLFEAENEQIEGDRERFGSQMEYMASVLGYAAGYGSLWRFPYLVFDNGGGTFLIPYFAILLSVGIPLFYFETAIGQVKCCIVLIFYLE